MSYLHLNKSYDEGENDEKNIFLYFYFFYEYHAY